MNPKRNHIQNPTQMRMKFVIVQEKNALLMNTIVPYVIRQKILKNTLTGKCVNISTRSTV